MGMEHSDQTALAPEPPTTPLGLLGLVGMPADLRQALAANKIVVGGVDGTHMGPAINWWAADVAPRHSPTSNSHVHATVIDDIVAVVEPSEALRSALEVILALVAWISRNDHESEGDHGVRILRGLAADPLLLPSQRILCSDLAAAIDADAQRSDFTVHRLDVEPAMRLIVFLSRAVEQRFSIPVEEQITTFRDAVLASQMADR